MRIKSIAVLVVVFAGLLSACGREPTVLDVTARDYGFSGVAGSINGGPVKVTWRNEGKALHELAFLNMGDTSLETFKKDVPAWFNGGPFPSWAKGITGAGDLEPGKSVTTTITLPKGKYLMFCSYDDAPGPGETTTKPHYELGMYQNVSVEGPDTVTAEDLDAPGGTFRAKDYTFEAPAGLEAGKNEFAFVNDGPKQWHFMDVSVFPEGTTVAQAEAAFGKLLQMDQNSPPPAGIPMPEEIGGTGVYSPGQGQTFTATFRSGRTYIAVCFIHDLAGGPPHAIGHHMYKAFTVK